MKYMWEWVCCYLFFVSFNSLVFRERELSLGFFISFNKCFIDRITFVCFIYHQLYTKFRLNSFSIITRFVKRADDIVGRRYVVK